MYRRPSGISTAGRSACPLGRSPAWRWACSFPARTARCLPPTMAEEVFGLMTASSAAAWSWASTRRGQTPLPLVPQCGLVTGKPLCDVRALQLFRQLVKDDRIDHRLPATKGTTRCCATQSWKPPAHQPAGCVRGDLAARY